MARASGARLGHHHHEDEAARLPAALASAAWAHEIVVVDAGSTDRTADLARAAGARVVVEGGAVSAQKNRRRTSPATTGSCPSTPTNSSPARRRRCARCSRRDRVRGYRIPRVTRAFGRELRATTGTPTGSSDSTIGAPVAGTRAARCTSRCGSRRTGRLAGESSMTAIATCRAPAEDRPLHDARRRGQRRRRPRRLAPRDRRHPPLAFLRNYVLRRGFTAAPPAWWCRR